MSAAPQPKPAQDERPRLMRELGVYGWSNVPNTDLEAWMANEDHPLWFRVLACVVRHSVGYSKHAEVQDGAVMAIRLEDRRAVPLRQVDVAEILGQPKQHVNRAVQYLEAIDGSVRAIGQKLFFLPVPKPLGRQEPEDQKSPDPVTFEPLRDGYFQVLQVTKACYQKWLKVTGSDGAYKEESSEVKSKYVRGFVTDLLRALGALTDGQTDGLSEPSENERLKTLEEENRLLKERLERLERQTSNGRNGKLSEADLLPDELIWHEYLKAFTRSVGRAPKPEETRQLVTTLPEGTGTTQFDTYVRSRAKPVKAYTLLIRYAEDFSPESVEAWNRAAAAGPQPVAQDDHEEAIENARSVLDDPEASEGMRQAAERVLAKLERRHAHQA